MVEMDGGWSFMGDNYSRQIADVFLQLVERDPGGRKGETLYFLVEMVRISRTGKFLKFGKSDYTLGNFLLICTS